MWKILQWISIPTSKERTDGNLTNGATHENDSESTEVTKSTMKPTSMLEPTAQHLEQQDSISKANEQFFAPPVAAQTARNELTPATMGELSERLERMNSIERAAEEARLRNSTRPGQFQHDKDIRKSGMAYWRKNTRKERPSDALFYEQLTSPASSSSWQDPFTADSRASRSTRDNRAIQPGQDLTSFATYLTNTNKNYLSGIYAQKNQAEIDSQSLQILPRLSDVSDRMSPTTEDYPHYSGGWTAEKLNYEQEKEQAPVETSDSLDQKHEWEWNMPAALTEEIVQIACNLSSKTPRDDEKNIEEQSTTMDPVPYEQFVDVRIAVADHPDTSTQVLLALAHDINPDVRFAIAENHNADEEVLRMLTEDENPYVAHRAVKTLQRIEGGVVKHRQFSARNSIISDRMSERG